MIKSASVSELKQWLQLDEVVLIDVREAEEYAQGHIEGSSLIPLATVSGAKLPDYKGKKLVMQCRSGGRSRTACGVIAKEIPNVDVYNLEGGIMAWQQAGYDVA